MYSRSFDKLYREPTDGYIGIRFNREHVGEQFAQPTECGMSIQEPNKEILLPRVELVTIIDLSSLWEDKQQQAGQIAEELYKLNHENLLNLTRPIIYLDNHIEAGMIQVHSECPDHFASWK